MLPGCEREVMETLQDLLALRLNGLSDREEALFDAQQNARIVANAENYYRTMIRANEDCWNVRDRHMTDTLGVLLERYGSESKAIVWAHNTHIGDYRATPMATYGQINIGGLARERWGKEQVALAGFGTFEGKVVASHAWDGPIEVLSVPPGRAGSYEALFHEAATVTGSEALVLPDLEQAEEELSDIRGHRAIGVVYQPAHERLGNYVPTSLSNRYDSFVFIDKTTALDPLIQEFDREELPETWPAGL
jgi:erythromycin esterase